MHTTMHRIAVALVLATIASGATVLAQGQAGPDSDIEAVRALLREDYLFDVPASVLQRSTVDSILMGTDPYTHVFENSEDDFRTLFDDKSYDLGMEFGKDRQGIFVDRVDYGSPSYGAGVCLGDRVQMIDGISTDGMTWRDAMRAVVQAERSGIILNVIRGIKPVTIKIPVKATYPDGLAIYLEPPTAYVQITSITSSTGFSLSFSAVMWKRKGITRVVLDLRDCGGGSVRGAREVLELFAKDLDVLYIMGDRTGTMEYTRAQKTGYCHGMPVVVLVDRNTASAAEMIAVGLHDLGYAAVMGDTTYGKGVSQVVHDLPSGKGMALTSSRIYGPSGRNVDRYLGNQGLVPSLLIPPSQLRVELDYDTLRMVTAALPSIPNMRERYTHPSTETVSKMQSKLPRELKRVAPLYVAVSIWADQGRAWWTSQMPFLAEANATPTSVQSSHGQRR